MHVYDESKFEVFKKFKVWLTLIGKPKWKMLKIPSSNDDNEYISKKFLSYRRYRDIKRQLTTCNNPC